MKCVNCGKIINENALNCPYCGCQIIEDYFGYRRSNEQIKQQRPQKKDNSGKIILIIFSAIAGVFSIAVTLVFMMSSGSDTSAQIQYEGTFSISQEFVFSVTDTYNSDTYSVIMNSDFTNPGSMILDAGEESKMYLDEGVYTVVIMRSRSEKITLQMVVDADCEYNTVELMFDARQIKTTAVLPGSD